MDKVVIEINGVRHALVPDDQIWFECGNCSLVDLCRIKKVLICNMFDGAYHHFEVEPTIPQL